MIEKHSNSSKCFALYHSRIFLKIKTENVDITVHWNILETFEKKYIPMYYVVNFKKVIANTTFSVQESFDHFFFDICAF